MKKVIVIWLLIVSNLWGIESYDIGIIHSQRWFYGKKSRLLSLFTVKNNKILSIPYQIDRKNKDGTYSLKRVKIIGQRDEIVFQVEDANDRNDNLVRSKFPGKCIMRVKVTEGKETGWIYFIYPLPNTNTESYVRYKRKNNTEFISTPYYQTSYQNESIFFHTYKVTPKAGGNLVNIIDTMKLRFVIKTFFGIKFERTEKDLTYKVIGVKVGPIRIIRKTSSQLKVFLGLKSPAILVDNYYTKYFLETPSYLTVPFKLSYVASNAYYRQTISYTSAILGDKLYCNGCRKPLLFNGHISPYEKATKVEPLTWSALIGPTGNILYLAKWSKDLPVTKNLYFFDDSEASDPLEHLKGIYEFGYLIGDVLKLRPKKYEFSLSIFALPKWDKNSLDEALKANNSNPVMEFKSINSCL